VASVFLHFGGGKAWALDLGCDVKVRIRPSVKVKPTFEDWGTLRGGKHKGKKAASVGNELQKRLRFEGL